MMSVFTPWFLAELAPDISFDWYAWVIMPVLIFAARVCDVTLGTLRIIFVSRGLRKYAPLLGFFEVLIWIVIIGQLVQHLHSATAYIAYAGGFAAGNFVGLWLEDRLAFGTMIVRVMIANGGKQLVEKIHNAGFGVTSVDGKGSAGPVMLVYTVVKRRDLKRVMDIIHGFSENTFVTVEEVKSTERGIFPLNSTLHKPIFSIKKSK